MKHINVLLSGIVGSTAYGLARPGSDTDRLGIFATPTQQLHGLHKPAESHVTTSPDRTLHEAAKWCRLALGGNPTVMELVWLPDELYEVRTPLGDELIGIRTAFLSAKKVRDAYLGYATQQFRRLEARGDGSFSADTRKRTAKHARHLKRLCHQGLELYTTGRLTIRVDDPDAYHDFGAQVAADPAAARPLLARYETAFDENRSALPDQPDEAAVDAWLHRVRAHHYPATARAAVLREAADIDLTAGPCPLCPHPVTLHTPSGASAHFSVVHPERRLTGRHGGPWPRLVADAEAQPAAPETPAADEPESLPLLLWGESADVTHEDGRITVPISRAVNLARSVPAGQLVLPLDEAARLRRALTAALNDADDEEASDSCPGTPERPRCPRCGDDLTDYAADDHVFLTGDGRPYCSQECVVATWRASQKRQPEDGDSAG